MRASMQTSNRLRATHLNSKQTDLAAWPSDFVSVVVVLPHDIAVIVANRCDCWISSLSHLHRRKDHPIGDANRWSNSTRCSPIVRCNVLVPEHLRWPPDMTGVAGVLETGYAGNVSAPIFLPSTCDHYTFR
ncbi:unnamed protein product [Soboliphyme baturini]|uniref:Uncharacterized protein n=1 Tax=Soboliphyme baturini TaxID=241478 RepID=A0A183IYQ5_9BILA|nr:unnamed protein product [Soboliphyme baturini]